MKKYICLLLVMALCFGIVGCGDGQQNQSAETVQSSADNQTIESDGESETNYVFRYANWGDDIETVEAKESIISTYKDDSFLIYENIGYESLPADATYFFSTSGFVSGWYDITNVYDDELLLENDFDEIDSFLKQKYGRPLCEKQKQWTKVVLKSDDSLATFDVIYQTFWQTENVRVLHWTYTEASCIKHKISFNIPNNNS